MPAGRIFQLKLLSGQPVPVEDEWTKVGKRWKVIPFKCLDTGEQKYSIYEEYFNRDGVCIEDRGRHFSQDEFDSLLMALLCAKQEVENNEKT